jgi:hypothetical protein
MKCEITKTVIDGYTRLCLTAIAVLLTVMVIGLWAHTPGPSEATAAEMPRGFDAAGQRRSILEAQQETNKKLGELIELLRSGQAKVQVAAPAASGESNAATQPKK